LFRNGIPDYDRVSRPLQKWLTRLLQWTVEFRAEHRTGWAGGLNTYDKLTQRHFAPFYGETGKIDESFAAFCELCDFLAAELDAAKRK
jgi:hypothetical protein